MGRSLKHPVDSSWLATKLGLPHFGTTRAIEKVDSADTAGDLSFCFVKNEGWAHRANPRALLMCKKEHLTSFASGAILSLNPRLDFARALSLLDALVGFKWSDDEPIIHPTAIVGQYCVIGKGVKIGAHSVIHHHVVIGAEVEIGQHCTIKSGAIVGEDGFGFERDDSGTAIRLPHIGGVVIGDDVEIGSITTVCRGTISNTTISKGVKIDDHVHIAHNIHVGEDAFIIACAEISGGVRIGKRAWIAPAATVLNQIAIGDDATIGLGAVVVRSVEANTTVVGNPAKPLPPKP